MHLSIVVIAKNEEDRIEACLKSCSFGDELILLDSGSTDKTVEIAKRNGARVISAESGDFADTRNKGMKEAKGEWVLYVDADERVLKPLQGEIRELAAGTGYSAVALSRINVIFGQRVSYGPYKKDWMIRLFKKSDFETWVGKVHEYGKFKGELGYSKNSLLHLTHRDLDHFVLKALDWSKIDAKLRFDAHHPKMTKLRFMRILFTESWNQLIKREGLFGGTVGFIDSMLQVFSFYMTYVRLWELQQSKSLEKIYKEIDQKLLENDFQFKE
jgi:glycosyltransferase involved in cell wall biosynthesis